MRVWTGFIWHKVVTRREAVVNRVMNLCFPQKAEDLLTNLVTIIFSRRVLYTMGLVV